LPEGIFYGFEEANGLVEEVDFEVVAVEVVEGGL